MANGTKTGFDGQNGGDAATDCVSHSDLGWGGSKIEKESIKKSWPWFKIVMSR